MACEHVRQVRPVQPRTPKGCEECLFEKMRWVHLRLCLTCGHVGCCDSSLGKHARHHFEETGHAIMRSFEPGERWGWCFIDRIGLTFAELGLEENQPAHL